MTTQRSQISTGLKDALKEARKYVSEPMGPLGEALPFCAHEAPLPFQLFSSEAGRSQLLVTCVPCLEDARVAPPRCCQAWRAVRAGGGVMCRRSPSSGPGGRRWGVSTPRRRAPTGACCPGPRGWSPGCGWCPQCRCSPPSGRRSARTPAAGGRSPSPASPGSRPRRA